MLQRVLDAERGLHAALGPAAPAEVERRRAQDRFGPDDNVREDTETSEDRIAGCRAADGSGSGHANGDHILPETWAKRQEGTGAQVTKANATHISDLRVGSLPQGEQTAAYAEVLPSAHGGDECGDTGQSRNGLCKTPRDPGHEQQKDRNSMDESSAIADGTGKEETVGPQGRLQCQVSSLSSLSRNGFVRLRH